MVAECCDTAWAEFSVTCAELESSYYWDCSGCTCPGDSLDFSNNSDYSSITVFNKSPDMIQSEVNIETSDFLKEANNEKLFNYLRKNLRSLMSNSSLNDSNESKEYFHANSSTRDLIGYNVLRDGNEIAFTSATNYDDNNVQVDVEYCYTVQAVYDEGVSSSSNQACAAASPVPNSSDLSVGSASASTGESVELEISLDNEDAVAGFQFTFTLSPDIGTVVGVSETVRTSGFNLSTNNGIIIGFSLTGDVIDPGTGPIVLVEVVGNSSGTASACLNDVILSNPSGQAMLVETTCGSLSVSDGPISGCTDSGSM